MQVLSKKGRKELATQVDAFLQQYQRKAQKNTEPNDRHYSRSVEQVIRRLKPEDLDILLNGEEDERLNGSDEASNKILVWVSQVYKSPGLAARLRVKAQRVIAVSHHARAMQAAVGILQLEVEIVLRYGQRRRPRAQQVERTRVFVRLVVGRVQEHNPGRTALQGDHHLARQDGGSPFQPERRQVL